MKNALSKTHLTLIFCFAGSLLFAQQSTWSFGLHTIMGISGGIRKEKTTFPVTEGIEESEGQEQLQATYGLGCWLERSLNSRWSVFTTVSFQRLKVLANSTYLADTPDIYNWHELQTSWTSQYLQLDISGRYYLSDQHIANRWFIGLGVQGIYVHRHKHYLKSSFVYRPGSGGGIPISGFEGQLTNSYVPVKEDEIEKSPFGLGGRLEIGARINRWSLSLVNTAFFQKRRKGIPNYNRYLNITENPDGSATVTGVPLRYVRSATVQFAYQL